MTAARLGTGSNVLHIVTCLSGDRGQPDVHRVPDIVSASVHNGGDVPGSARRLEEVHETTSRSDAADEEGDEDGKNEDLGHSFSHTRNIVQYT